MNIPDRGPGQVRIGVAIPVPEPFAGRLQAARASFGDPMAETIPPHVTILGPTVLDEGLLPVVREHLATVAGTIAPFRLHLRGSASFRPVSPVVFVQVVDGIASCERLERAVRRDVLEATLRFNYHPHVTVAHEVPDEALDRAFAAMADFDAQFPVDSFALYELGDDGVWPVAGTFELTGT